MVSEEFQCTLTRTASGPYHNVTGNIDFAIPYGCNEMSGIDQSTYERCADVVDCIADTPTYVNVADLVNIHSQDVSKEKSYDPDRRRPVPSLPCCVDKSRIGERPRDDNYKEAGSYKRCMRSMSWDNGVYYCSAECIEGDIDDDPTYLHVVNTLPDCDNDLVCSKQCRKISSDGVYSGGNGIVRRGAFRKKCKSESHGK